MRLLSVALCLVALSFLVACDDGDGSAAGSLQNLKIRVDFEPDPGPSAKLAARGERLLGVDEGMTALTPSAYEAKICRLVLWNPSSDERFEVFSHATTAECPVFAFVEGEAATESLLPAGAVLPDEPGFNVAELDIVHLEMELPFHIEVTGQHETRRLRIYMTTDTPYFPGDVRVLRDGEFGDYWGFGPGNINGDPHLQGMTRSAAYSPIPNWPRGHSTAEWGPFGNAAFWQRHPPNPFTWSVALPTDDSDTVVIVFKVAQTWHFTDLNMDGIYDWPSDYGNDWRMEFPTIIGIAE